MCVLILVKVNNCPVQVEGAQWNQTAIKLLVGLLKRRCHLQS